MVSIIILSYNTKELLQECLESLYKNLKKIEFEVIVVDNASTDGSASEISRFRQGLRSRGSDPRGFGGQANLKLIENKKNVGFSKGNNIGAKIAKGEYLVFLNSDTEVRDDGLKGMINFLKSHTDVGILGGRLKNKDGSLQKSAGVFYTLSNVFLMLFGGEQFVRFSPKEIQEVDWVSGACFMIKKDLFSNLGGFDEHFFMYIEDMELCYRVKKMGYKVYFYPQANILHVGEGSSQRSFAIIHIYKGLLYFYAKHKSYIQYIMVKTLLIFKAIVAMIIGVVTFNKKLAITYRKALVF